MEEKAPPRVPQLKLMEKSIVSSPAVSSRIAQLTARIDREHNYDVQDQSARNLVLESKCKAVRSRISAAKETQADRLKPMCELLARIGADIAEIVEKIDASDKRLDGELHATQDKYTAENEALAADRAQAKARLNYRIGPACDTLRTEFETSKTSARDHQEKRHKKACEKVLSIVDMLDSEYDNRARADTRTVSTIGKRHAAVDGAVLAERGSRLQTQHDLNEKIDDKAAAFVLEQQQEKKIRQENAKNSMKGFRNAMLKLADTLDNESQLRTAALDDICDKQTVQLEELSRLISKEASVRAASAVSWSSLLEDMHQKLHREIKNERTERQNTERVLMKLLEESVDSIAIRADPVTLQQLRDLRQEREVARAKRDKEMDQRALVNQETLGSPSQRQRDALVGQEQGAVVVQSPVKSPETKEAEAESA